MYERTYHQQVLKDTEKDAPEKRGFPWRRVLIVTLILVVIGGAIYAIRHPKLQVATIDVQGTQVLDSEEVRLFVDELLSGNTLFIFPRKSVLLLQTNTIEKKVHEKFSRIQAVSVTREGVRGLRISITEYTGAFLWCTDETQCYFMDQQGVVYSVAPQFSGTAYMKIFSGAPLQTLPFTGVAPAVLSIVDTLQKDLLTINVTPLAFRMISPREARIDFLHNKNTAQFIIDPTVPVQTSLEYLFSGIRTEPLAGAFRDSTKKLLYIDVRFPNNIVYRFANE